MSKLSSLAAASIMTVSLGLNAVPAVFAQTPPDPGHIQIARPKINSGGVERNVGFSTLGDFIQKTMTLAFIIAVILVLAFLIWGAFEWITSGGDKEAVGKARNRIINALIGLAVLAIAFALFQVAGQFLGFNVLDFNIPTPSP